MYRVEGKSTLSCPMGFQDTYPLFQCQDCMFWWCEQCDCATMVAIEGNVGRLGIIYPELTNQQLRILARYAGSIKTQQECHLALVTVSGL